MGLVAEGELDGPEELIIGQVREVIGHLSQGPVEEGAKPVEESRAVGRRHGRHPASETNFDSPSDSNSSRRKLHLLS
jgi:hypothetical protein